MQKIDHKREFKHLYHSSAKKPSIVTVPEMNFIMVDGKGDPNASPAFSNAVEALFSVSYTLKFMIKKSDIAIDYKVMPLQGLWWADDMTSFASGDKSQWYWTLMMMQPEFVTEDLYRSAIEQVLKKKALPVLSELRFEAFKEGESAQIMHIGPFSEEGPTIQRLHNFIASEGRVRLGKHHEIYLSDTRRAAPEKWKTIIRQPIS